MSTRVMCAVEHLTALKYYPPRLSDRNLSALMGPYILKKIPWHGARDSG